MKLKFFFHCDCQRTFLLGSAFWIELCRARHMREAEIGMAQFDVNLAEVIVDLGIFWVHVVQLF